MRGKEKLLDKKISNLKSKKITKKKSLQEKGITLIALVVTIIILLILAGVTLNIALSDNGLFSKTQEAAEKYKQAQSDEEEMVRQIATQMNSEYVGAEVTGYDLTGNTNKTYKATTDETGYAEEQTINRKEDGMQWRIWDFDGNILWIIGDSTDDKLYLQGVIGYNNGVDILDDICNELYSNGKKEVYASNLKRSDIQRVSTYDYTKYKYTMKDENGENIGEKNFGESITISDVKCPRIWNNNDKKWTYEYKADGTVTTGDKEGKIWETRESSEEKSKEDIISNENEWC